MAYTTVNKSSDFFNTVLYNGTGSAQSITGVGFQPDWLWQKQRSGSQDSRIFDAVRGGSKVIYSSLNNAESTDAQLITSFDSDGFTMGSSGTNVNDSGTTNVAWNWKANGAGSSNTNGSITSTVSANTTSGFSIVKWTGSGGNATIGHGLNTAPTAIFVKNLDAAEQWINYDVSNGPTKYYHLNLTDAVATGSTIWNNTAPTTSVFSVGTVANVNTSGANYVAYCFSNITGFSKVGSYTGNANADGVFQYLGFKPAFVLIKSVSTTDWNLYDNKRLGYNGKDAPLFANLANAESTDYGRIDFLSNGFKIRTTNAQVNNNNTVHIFMAFAEAPLVGSNNVPATAR